VILLDVASWVLILAGSAFIVAGALGVLRFPDVYTRMHAASVIETLGAGTLFAGLMLQSGFNQVTLKLLFILVLFFFTGPVITHALAQAALHAGLKPELDEDRRDRMRDEKAGGTARPDAGRLP
jgi:multicomponent Na+:H+ antiporter subunit G